MASRRFTKSKRPFINVEVMISENIDVALSLDRARESINSIKGILKNKKENLRNSHTQLHEIRKIAHDKKRQLKNARSNIEKHVTILEEKTSDLNKLKKEQNELYDNQIQEVRSNIKNENNNIQRLKAIELIIEKEFNSLNLNFSSAYEDFQEISQLNGQDYDTYCEVKEAQLMIEKIIKELNVLFSIREKKISQQISIENNVQKEVKNYFSSKLQNFEESSQNNDQVICQKGITELENIIESLQKSENELANQLQKKVSEVILKRKQWKATKKELLMSRNRKNKFDAEIMPEFKQTLKAKIQKIHEEQAAITEQIENCQFNRVKLRRAEKILRKKEEKYESKISQETTKGYELEIKLNSVMQEWIPVQGQLIESIQKGKDYVKILTKLQSQISIEDQKSRNLKNYQINENKEIKPIIPYNHIMINAYQHLLDKTNRKIDSLKSELEQEEEMYQLRYTQYAQTRFTFFKTKHENLKEQNKVKEAQKQEIKKKVELFGPSLSEQITNLSDQISIKRSRIQFKDQNLSRVEKVHGLSNHYEPFVIEDFERVYDRTEARKQRIDDSFDKISNLKKIISDLTSLERSYRNYIT